MKSKRKIPKVFISFLVVSTLIWVIITFSKTYKTEVTFPVVFNNLPQDKLLKDNKKKEVILNIRSTGINIFRAKLFGKKINLDASNLRKNKKGQFYFLLSKQQSKIENQLFSETELLSIVNDTVFLNVGQLTSKKVRLVPDININYQVGYDLLDSLKVTPDSITISGPDSQIDSITKLSLAKLSLNDVKDDINQKLEVVKPKDLKNTKFSSTFAIVSGNVEKFTEGTLNIPFEIKNKPNDINIYTLSETVEVSYVVALSKFEEVTENSFLIECDYEVSKNQNLTYLIPKVIQSPDFIKSYKITPSKIDFLIQK